MPPDPPLPLANLLNTFTELLALLKDHLQTIAYDSGLEVYGLRGAPGVRSRRFFGEDATADERNAKLLVLLVCVTALASPDGHVELFEGEVHGEIAMRRAGRPLRVRPCVRHRR